MKVNHKSDFANGIELEQTDGEVRVTTGVMMGVSLPSSSMFPETAAPETACGMLKALGRSGFPGGRTSLIGLSCCWSFRNIGPTRVGLFTTWMTTEQEKQTVITKVRDCYEQNIKRLHK